MDYRFALACANIFRAVDVEFFHEHSAFRPNAGFDVSNFGHHLCNLGFEWVSRKHNGGPGFLKKVWNGKELERVEIIGDNSVPEHEAFAVRTLEDFQKALDKLKTFTVLTHLPNQDRLDEGGVQVAIFRVSGYDTALQLIFRPKGQELFDPAQVFREQ